jgi:O-antigen/teichoic acid export membrane protein
MPLSRLLTRRTSFLANTALLAGGAGLSQVVLAITAPLLTRLYSPADFGVYAVLLALVNFASIVASLRYEGAIVLPRTDRAAANLAALSLALAAAVSLASVPVALLLWRLDARLTPALALLIPLSVAALGVQQVMRAWLMRRHLFGAVTLILVVQSVVMVALQIAAGLLWGSHPFPLMAASLTGTLAGTLAGLPALRGSSWTGLSLRRARAMAGRYRRFALYTAPYSFVAQVSQRGPILLLAALGTAATTGAFALAQRIVYLPIGVIASSLSQAFYRHAAGRLAEPDVQALLRRVLLCAALALGPVFVIAGFNMETLFGLAFGAAWRSAGRYGAWLALAGFTSCLTYWLDRVYDLAGRQRLALVLELGFNLASLSIFGLVLYRTHNAEWATAALAITAALYSLLYLAVTLRIARSPWRTLGETVAAMLGMGLYGALVHYGVRSLVGYGAAYGVLVTLLILLPMLMGIRIAVENRRP